MPNSCSAPGCTSNYNSDEHVPVFKLPNKPDELRHAWIRALRRDDLDDFKRVYVCVKHFREEDIEYMHIVPNGDGTFRKEPRAKSKVKEGAVPVFLPGCPSISQPTTSTKRKRLSLDSREEELLNQTLSLSLKSASEEKVKFKINTFQELQAKLSSISLFKLWPLWYPDEYSVIFMHPSLVDCTVRVDAHLLISHDLSVRAFHKGEFLPLSLCSICDIRQLESILR